ncbi:MAG: DUF2490 domain-containing protein [Flavobacteriales bacterium]
MRPLLALPLLVALRSAFAQNAITYGLFPTIDHSGDLGRRWSYNIYLFDAIKAGDDGSVNATVPNGDFYAYAELGGTCALSKRWFATASYVHEQQFPFEPHARVENRLFQQLTFKGPKERLDARLRLRFDERWIRAHDADASAFSSRLRLLGGLTWPNDERAYLTGYCEGFVTTSGDLSYDETWATAQVGWKLGEHHAIEAGALFIDWRMPYGWMHQRYLQVSWVSHIDLPRPSRSIHSSARP